MTPTDPKQRGCKARKALLFADSVFQRTCEEKRWLARWQTSVWPFLFSAPAHGRAKPMTKFQIEALAEWLSIAVHEAGHAVVAAHLKIPFSTVSIRPNSESAGRVSCDEESYSRCTAEHKAIMLLAARAAVEQYVPVDEADFRGDERCVMQLAADFPAGWREQCLTKARAIVRRPDVHDAIERVAIALQSMQALTCADVESHFPN